MRAPEEGSINSAVLLFCLWELQTVQKERKRGGGEGQLLFFFSPKKPNNTPNLKRSVATSDFPPNNLLCFAYGRNNILLRVVECESRGFRRLLPEDAVVANCSTQPVFLCLCP